MQSATANPDSSPPKDIYGHDDDVPADTHSPLPAPTMVESTQEMSDDARPETESTVTFASLGVDVPDTGLGHEAGQAPPEEEAQKTPWSERPAHWDLDKDLFTSRHHADNTGVRAAIILIRTLVSYLSAEHDGLESIIESESPLFQYACINVGNSSSSIDTVLGLRIQAEESLSRITGGLSFYNMTEDNNNAVLQQFWQRKDLRFFSLWSVERVSSRLQLSKRESYERAKEERVTPKQLAAQESLLPWDGSTSLNSAISSDCLEDSLDGYRLHRAPVCVRVQYTPSNAHCPRFTDLMADPLCIPNKFKVPDVDDDIDSKVEGSVHYRLILVVRLRSLDARGCQQDYTRLYSPNGQYIQPRSTAGGVMPPGVSDEWSLGEPGHSYMLYFVKSGTRILDLAQLRETAESPSPFNESVQANQDGDASTLVIKTIVGHMHPSFWNSRSVTRGLLESLTVGMDFPDKSEANMEQQKMQVIEKVCETFSSERSLLENTENRRMWSRFWGREHVRFLRGYVATRIEMDASCFPMVTITEDETQSRAKACGMVVAEMLAKESLLKWDGTVSLGFAIRTYLKTTSNYRGQSTWPLPNFPLCIRVLYTPKNNKSPRLQEILTLPLKFGARTEPWTQRDGTCSMKISTVSFSYRLVATVRLRSEKSGNDQVRLYKTSGEPHTSSRDEWQVGDPGHSYMLYFVASNDKMADMPRELGQGMG